MSPRLPAHYCDANAATATAPPAWQAYADRLGAPPLAPLAAAELQSGLLAALGAWLGVPGDSLHPTSGGTEADALGLLGAVLGMAEPGARTEPVHVLTSCLEHPAVLATLAQAAEQGLLTYASLPADPQGQLQPAALAAARCPRTRLVSLPVACGETGVLQPVAAVADWCREQGLCLHVDAVQAAGRIPLTPAAWGVDLLALSGHKLGAVGGTGLLYVRPGLPFVAPWPLGPTPEEPRNLAGLASLRAASALPPPPDWARPFEQRLSAAVPDVAVIGAGAPRLQQTSCLRLRGCSGEALLMALDVAGFAVSCGSACRSGALDPSPTLLGMGLTPAEAREAVRFSFHAGTTDAALTALVAELARLAPLLRAEG